MVRPEAVKYGARVGEAATYRPPTSAAMRRSTPRAEASSVRPGRQTFIQ
jgi:hypothetical protein